MPEVDISSWSEHHVTSYIWRFYGYRQALYSVEISRVFTECLTSPCCLYLYRSPMRGMQSITSSLVWFVIEIMNIPCWCFYPYDIIVRLCIIWQFTFQILPYGSSGCTILNLYLIMLMAECCSGCFISAKYWPGGSAYCIIKKFMLIQVKVQELSVVISNQRVFTNHIEVDLPYKHDIAMAEKNGLSITPEKPG